LRVFNADAEPDERVSAEWRAKRFGKPSSGAPSGLAASAAVDLCDSDDESTSTRSTARKEPVAARAVCSSSKASNSSSSKSSGKEARRAVKRVRFDGPDGIGEDDDAVDKLLRSTVIESESACLSASTSTIATA
jgi:hypothetical protein